MALVTLVDALNKLKCNYTDFFIQRLELSKYDLECYGKSEDELWTIFNYWHMLNSGCEEITCNIDSYINQCTSTLNDIEICGETITIECNLDLFDTTVSCETFNLYQVI